MFVPKVITERRNCADPNEKVQNLYNYFSPHVIEITQSTRTEQACSTHGGSERAVENLA